MRGVVYVAFHVLLCLTVVTGLVMAVCFLAIWYEAARVPERPQHARPNRFAILSDRTCWTPQIAALHRTAVRFGLAWIACLLLIALMAFAQPAG